MKGRAVEPRLAGTPAPWVLEDAAPGSTGDGRYVLKLYVTGLTVRSARAIESTRALCDRHLEGRYELEVVDLVREPHRARDEQIICAPTLVKQHPLPLRRLVGDLSRSDRVLAGLGLAVAG